MIGAGFIAIMGVRSLAMVISRDRGSWPSSWPQELERYRECAATLEIASGIQETMYEIPFDSTAEFSNAWPHILQLKSKGAPLILEGSPSKNVLGKSMQAGVRILWPAEDSGPILPDGTRVFAKAPWPDSVVSPSGELPEYVRFVDGKWVAANPQERQAFYYRARVDIVLIVDGRIVDLNRIQLPTQTPIVDRRFKD